MGDPRSTIRLARCVPAFAMVAALSASACSSDGTTKEATTSTVNLLSTPAASFPSTFARQWLTTLSNSIREDANTPAVAARTYTYAAIGIYESIVHGMPGYRSLAGQLNGLDSLPVPDPNLEYDWPTVLAQTMHVSVNATYIYPLRLFYEYTTPTQAALEALGPIQIGFRRSAGVPENVIENSINFGTELGNALAAWMNADGYPEVRFRGIVPPTGPDKWVPTGFYEDEMVALPEEPWFGTVRPVVLNSGDECRVPPPPAWGTEPGAPMYEEANVVYQTELNLTDEEREIANFWADGPGFTGTPAGHWLALLTERVRSLNLADAAAAYAYVGLGMMDAFIAVWDSKYTYHLIRPETYIRRHIDPHWKPYLTTPQHPEYPSGHAGISGAMGALMDAYFGAAPFADPTKQRRGYRARTFNSYWEAAVEATNSRIYGGIHYPISGANGLILGQCVANAVMTRVSFTQ